MYSSLFDFMVFFVRLAAFGGEICVVLYASPFDFIALFSEASGCTIFDDNFVGVAFPSRWHVTAFEILHG